MQKLFPKLKQEVIYIKVKIILIHLILNKIAYKI